MLTMTLMTTLMLSMTFTVMLLIILTLKLQYIADVADDIAVYVDDLDVVDLSDNIDIDVDDVVGD